MHFLKTQCTADDAYFFNGALYGPERGIIGLVGAPASELVVEDDTAGLGGQCRHVYDVVVGNAGSTMQG